MSAPGSAGFVTVTIGNQLFGIPVLQVQDVFVPVSVTAVPLAPPEVGGVLNLRGRIVTVIDMRKRLGLPNRERQGAALAIGIERSGEHYGLLIDDVGDVLELDPNDIEPVPQTLDTKWRTISKGVYRLENSLLVVLDVDRLMTFERSLRAA
jgi:purine-binding chemotaxis protein CheW